MTQSGSRSFKRTSNGLFTPQVLIAMFECCHVLIVIALEQSLESYWGFDFENGSEKWQNSNNLLFLVTQLMKRMEC